MHCYTPLYIPASFISKNLFTRNPTINVEKIKPVSYDLLTHFAIPLTAQFRHSKLHIPQLQIFRTQTVSKQASNDSYGYHVEQDWEASTASPKRKALSVRHKSMSTLPDQKLMETFIPQKPTWKEGPARDSSVQCRRPIFPNIFIFCF